MKVPILQADVSVVILNWNGWRDTLRCLDSLAVSRIKPSRIIVCDNGSKDDSLAMVMAWARRNFPARMIPLLGEEFSFGPELASAPVVLIALRKNRGYAAGNNPGIRFALHAGSDFVWLLNNDTVVHPEALGALLEWAAKNPRAGVLGSTVLSADQPCRLECAGGCLYNPMTTIFKPAYAGKHLRRVPDLPEPRLDYVYGATLFAKSEVFCAAGLLNEIFFLFYEELDFCRRARKAGFGLGWCRSSLIIHKGGASMHPSAGGKTNAHAVAAYHETLSTLIYTWIHHAPLLPWVLCFRFFGKAYFLLKRRQAGLLRPVVTAYRDFLFRLRSGSCPKGPRPGVHGT